MSPNTEKSTNVEEVTNDGPPHNQLYGFWDPSETVVISGMAGRFPECDNVQELMDSLFAGIDLIKENDRRWPIGYCNLPGIGTMKDISRFDSTYFGVPPKHVNVMDPQLRIVLELTYEALLDAGVNPVEVRGSRTGVYYAVSMSDADVYWSSTEDRANGIGMLGSCKSFFANRIAYHFNFIGPSFAVDSGCATSLVAVNQAFTDMRTGLIDAAIVCASNVMLNPFYSQHLYKLGVLSPETVDRVFDAKATGYVRSEAVVVLYLRKKSEAKRVYADILHVRNNTDGFTSTGMTYPSGEMQSLNNCALYKDAGVDPDTVGYIEAHGTGTKVGDPEELNGLADLFCKKRTTALLVGSLKSNMGHSEAAAGLCSVVKMLIAMHTGLIPRNLHYEEPNPGVSTLFDGRMKIVDTVQELPNDLVGINAFGLGGTNSHVLLRRDNKVKSSVVKDQLPRLVSVSGRTEASINYMLDKIESLPRDDNFVGLLHDIHSKNIHKHGYRGYTILNTDSPAREVSQPGEEKHPVWFICTGWGAQWLGRARELMKFEVFERRINLCSKLLESKGINLNDIINNGSDNVPDDLITVFVSIAATQLALTDLIRSTGIEPDALIGISTGELTCAYIDGALTAEQVIHVAYHTAHWAGVADLPSASIAIVCGLSYEQVKALCPPEIVVAVHNDAKLCTVVGPKEQVPQFVKSLLSKGIIAKMVKSSAGVAFHSPHIATEAKVLAAKMQELIPNSKKACKHWISSSVPVTNGTIPLVQNFTADYFMNIVTSTVLVQEALQHIPDNAIVVEISPHCALQPTLQKVLPTTALSIGLMSRDEPKQAEFMLTGLGKMYNAGVQMNLASLYPKVEFPVPRGTHMIGPLVQWDHSAEWTVPKLVFKNRKDGSRPKKFSLVVDLTTEKDRYLRGHIVNQQQTFPSAGYLTLVWKAFAQVNENWFENLPVKMENVEFHEQTLLPDSGVLTFLVKFPKHYDHSSEFEMYESNRLVVSGFISMLEEEVNNEHLEESETVTEPEYLPLTAGDVYRDFHLRGFQYTGQFCSILESDNRGTSAIVKWQNNWVTFLDSILQFAQLGMNSQELYLPKRLKKLSINPWTHQQMATSLSGNAGVPIKMFRDANLVKTNGVKLQGLQLYLEHKTEGMQKDPELEKYIFIPYLNPSKTPLGESSEEAHHNALTVIMQMVNENLCSVPIKNAIELAGSQKEQSLLAPVLVPLINRLPMMNMNVTVVTETPEVFQQTSLLESLGIKVEEMTSDTLRDLDCHLLFGSSSHMYDAASLLKPGGFLLLERNLNDSVVQLPGFLLVASQCAGNTSYLLLRKNTEESSSVVVRVTSQNFSWLVELQTALRNHKYERRNVVLVTEGDNNCGLLGLITTLMHEPGGGNMSCVFIQDRNAPPFSLSEELYASQLQKQLCMNVYREGTWGSMRHVPIAQHNTKHPVEFAQVEVLNRGDLSTISWVEGPFKPQENKELCQVYYTSVNLPEALLISGDLPVVTGQSSLLGQEFSGYNSSGERVMGFVPGGTLSTQVVANSSLLWHVPDHWSLQQAATVPTAYLTSFYALLMRGHVRAGEWVLIHAGDSTVGQAAIAICFHIGCNIITTARSKEEHKSINSVFQHHCGLHIVDYNNVEDEVLALTGARGVDVVFNTLQSSEWDQALACCLAQDGRFMDLTLPNLSKNKTLGTSMLRNKTYCSIQLDILFGAQNKDMREVGGLMKAGLQSGIIVPLPTKVYPESQVDQAFRFVSTNKYAGKVLIKIHEERSNKLMNPGQKFVTAVPKLFVNPERVYVLAGGLGGFGMEVAQWLVERGAKKLVLISRRGVAIGYKSMQIRRWHDAGVTVLTSTQDITNEEGVISLIQKASELGPIGGIFILTMVLKDALLENQTEKNFQEVCRAKIEVTKSLDTVSQRLCPELEYFVVFSSVVCGRGNPGQSPYGMANSSMERICEARHVIGLPALAIQWGPIGDVGFVFDTMGNEAVICETEAQCISSCLRALEKLMTQPNPVVASHVLTNKQLQNNSSSFTEKEILSTVANVLGINDITAVTSNAGTEDFGIDSLMSTEIKNTLEDQFNVKLTSQQLYNLMASTLREQAA